MSEIKRIMDFLGRTELEGEVKGTHLGQILIYLQIQKTERMKSTLSKLALLCAMTKRSIKENYIEGLVEFGIITTKQTSNELIWNWVGEKAFNSIKEDETFMEYVKKKEKEEKEKINDKKAVKKD